MGWVPIETKGSRGNFLNIQTMKQIIKYKSREEWLQNRSKGIGASEAGTVLGLNPWETPYQLWRRKDRKSVV